MPPSSRSAKALHGRADSRAWATRAQSFAPAPLAPGVSRATPAEAGRIAATGTQPPVVGSYQRARAGPRMPDRSRVTPRDRLLVGGTQAARKSSSRVAA